jgi:ribonucleotide monophosphatase NagD (HAD superfamily)
MGIDRAFFDLVAGRPIAGRASFMQPRRRTFPPRRFPLAIRHTATGVDPIVAGKPFPYLMELSLQTLGTQTEDTLVVGDRLETDIAAGQAVGCPTALVLSGVSARDQAENWTPKIDLIADDLATLIG